tara:strand:+ start:2028 stop:4046 length:2019 start_codon:yes stop_codon:yes gene_type:complete
MKILYSRLLEAINSKPKIEDLCEDLTLIGIEVDEVKSFQGDKIIDFDLTPNRGDCFSVKGLARDYCAFKDKKLSLPPKVYFKGNNKLIKKIKLSSKEGCSAYSAISISNLNPKKKFPEKISKSLKAAGIQTIHPLVDIVNFVMLESGQPMHVFDLDKISGDIEVRFAKPKETIKILGEKDLKLAKDCLVIADEKEPIALAGISGGLNHSVSKKTKNFLIESAYFDPGAIKGRARRYGFQTDASQRFERGVDFNLHDEALKHVVNIVQDIYQTDISEIETIKNKYFPKNKKINISIHDINQKLGTSLKENFVKSILKRLEIKLIKVNKSNLTFEVPSHRFDLSIKEDLVEEIARIVGYDNLPQIKAEQVSQNYEKSNYDFTNVIKTLMKNKGFNEVINYSFLDKKILEDLGLKENSISLKNPLNNSLSTLRTSLLPSLTSNLDFNINRGQNFLKIFEIGKTFSKENPVETLSFAALIFDDEKFKNWNSNQNYDFYYLKGILEDFFEEFRVDNISWKKTKNDLLHPYESADIYLKNNLIGSVGSIHPKFLKKLDLKKPFHFFEIKVDLLPRNDLRKLKAPSIYPTSQRDFSFEVDKNITFEQIDKCIKESSEAFLISSKIFDVYAGKNIPEDKKSIAFRVSWGSSKKTLSEDEINEEVKLIISGMQKKLNAILR